MEGVSRTSKYIALAVLLLPSLVGMGTFYGGIAHVPVSSLILVSELAGSYDLLVPLMLVPLSSRTSSSVVAATPLRYMRCAAASTIRARVDSPRSVRRSGRCVLESATSPSYPAPAVATGRSSPKTSRSGGDKGTRRASSAPRRGFGWGRLKIRCIAMPVAATPSSCTVAAAR